MTFTVAVESKSTKEQFKAEDIKLFHQECGGGEIVITTMTWLGGAWRLYCRRCHMGGSVEVSNDGTILLMKTAIDGESRQIKQYQYGPHLEDDITVILRT